MKLLTVTVPCYNSQEYMDNCIRSLLAGGPRVEIIIIDDGSTDNTGNIADGYAEKYPDMIRVIHQENGGHGEGINQGLRHATGTYFKVVDSDDTLSADFPAFLDTLEQCQRQGGADLVVTNYYYVHADGKGDRSINYSGVLPQRQIFTWQQTRRFRPHQMLTIHSCTFRTEAMRQWGQDLPKHVFYEDNLMVYQTLPHVHTLYYLNVDLYRYWIGRPDQSVQRNVMSKRCHHQIQVTQQCFCTCHLEDIAEPMLRNYMHHELFLMFGISLLFTRLNKTAQADGQVDAMWQTCREFDPKWANHFRNRTLLHLLCLPGKFGQTICECTYHIANKIVRFN